MGIDAARRARYDALVTIEEAVGAGLGTLSAVAELVRNAARRLQTEIETAARPVLRAAQRLPLQRPPERAAAPAVVGVPGGGAQEQVEEAKYYLAGGRDRPVIDRESAELPRHYGSDRLVLLPRDPWWLFAYWEVTPATHVEALRTLGHDADGARDVLRVHDVTRADVDGRDASSFFDVDFAPGAESWYVNVGKPGAAFRAEVGLRTAAGCFVALARSNAVHTPRAQPEPEGPVRWMTLRPPTGGGAPAVAWSGRYVTVEGATTDAPGSRDPHPSR